MVVFACNGKISYGRLRWLGLVALAVEKISFKWSSLQDSLGNWGWMADSGVKVSCLEAHSGDKLPPSHFDMAHNPHQVFLTKYNHHNSCIIITFRWKRGGWRKGLTTCTWWNPTIEIGWSPSCQCFSLINIIIICSHYHNRAYVTGSLQP